MSANLSFHPDARARRKMLIRCWLDAHHRELAETTESKSRAPTPTPLHSSTDTRATGQPPNESQP